MDIAASIQAATRKFLLRMARWAHKETGMKYLTMAGGVALNCVANGGLLREAVRGHLIQPRRRLGGALGAAFLFGINCSNANATRRRDCKKEPLGRVSATGDWRFFNAVRRAASAVPSEP